MKRLVVALVMLAAVVVPASPVSAGGQDVFIGGPPFGFSLCAEIGTSPNNWILTVSLSPSVFEQYASADSNSVFHAGTKTGTVGDNTSLLVHSASNPILGALSVSYKSGGAGTVDFKETSPIHVKYHLTGPATVNASGSCSEF